MSKSKTSVILALKKSRMNDGTLPQDSATGQPARSKLQPDLTSSQPSYLQETQTSRRKAVPGMKDIERGDDSREQEPKAKAPVKEYGPPQSLPPLFTVKNIQLQPRDYRTVQDKKVTDEELEQIHTSCRYIIRPDREEDKLDVEAIVEKKE